MSHVCKMPQMPLHHRSRPNRLLLGYFATTTVLMIMYGTKDIIKIDVFKKFESVNTELMNSLIIHFSAIIVMFGYSILSLCFINQWCKRFTCNCYTNHTNIPLEESTDSLMELQNETTVQPVQNNTPHETPSWMPSWTPSWTSSWTPSWTLTMPAPSQNVETIIENSILLTLVWVECTIGIIYIKNDYFLQYLSIGVASLLLCGLMGRLIQQIYL